MNEATYEDFLKLDIRVGKIIKADVFPEARKPAYKLWIDLGELGVKKSSAGLTKLYKPQDLINQKIIAVTNFSPKQVANFISEVLVLGVVMDEGKVALVQPNQEVPLGLRIF
ncbi:protein CsaA [Lyngbya aestuarii BL J]|uniref:Protein CsaA n=1 Tax=Lyngbya aestuarii BL J TaxID=1348334 RepID=U7QBC1_9CYAN|nr:tRNA-binding protein [Lyngbya aestuarii]ERT04026.1 protein CsaA [Lyngbya aestuarii BL J]